MKLERHGGKPVSPQAPLPIDNMGAATDRETVSAETVTFVGKAAAGSAGINALDKRPVLNKIGDKVGSFWGKKQNLKYRTGSDYDGGTVTSLTETATSAALVINDPNNDLELLFEEATTSRFVIRVYDTSGGTLYGWVGAIAASSNAYTIDIFNSSDVSGGTQSWVGTLASFDNTENITVEIYSYDTSFSWGTGTVLTKEVNYDESVPDYKILKNLSNGEYAIDYERGRVLYKRATSGASDTATYDVPSTSTASISTVTTKTIPDPVVVNATGAVAIATSTTNAAHFKLNSITCNFDSAPTTSENFTVTLNANDGAAYDTVLYSVDPSASSATDIVFVPDEELIFESGDELDVAFTNTDTNTYGLRIVTQLI